MRRTVAAVLGAVALLAPAAAHATWPGRDGLLAVQPVSGGGILLVRPAGRVLRRVCPAQTRGCERAPDPMWSPDGRKLAFGSLADDLSIVYADGTCLACGIVYSDDTHIEGQPVFEPNGRSLVFEYQGNPGLGLWTVQEDGLNPPDLGPGRRFAVADGGSEPAVSAEGRLAFVRRHRGQQWVFVTNRTRTRATAIAPGEQPSWSPDGRSLALDHAGRVQTLTLASGHPPRSLVRGRAPVFSPNGQRLAYLDPRGFVSLIAAHGGAAHRIGSVRGRNIDWQPLVAHPNRCDPPAGSRVVYRTAAVTVTDRADADSEVAYMACWRTRGVLRLLDTTDSIVVPQERIFGYQTTGRYLLFRDYVSQDGLIPSTYSVLAFDLARGPLLDDVAGESNSFAYPLTGAPSFLATSFAIDELLLSPTGAVAWLDHTTGHTSTATSSTTTSTTPGATTTTQTSTTFNSNPTTTYEIVLHDRAGKRVLDSATQTGPTPPLTDLQLSGGTVRWLDNGQPHTATTR